MKSSDNMQKFMIWLITSIVLGALPWFVNFIIILITEQMNYYSVFRVNDLMFFVIVISATTMLDLLITRDEKNTTRILFSIILLIQVLIAALFLGLFSLNIAQPPATGLYNPIQYRLITGSLILCSFSFITTFSLQINICFFSKIIDIEK